MQNPPVQIRPALQSFWVAQRKSSALRSTRQLAVATVTSTPIESASRTVRLIELRS
jgi:hypothetical protein